RPRMSLERDPWRGIVYNGFSQSPAGGAKPRPRARPRRGLAIAGVIVAALGVAFTVAAFAFSDRFLSQVSPALSAKSHAVAPRPRAAPAPSPAPVALPSPPVAELADQPAPPPTPSAAEAPPPPAVPADFDVKPKPRPRVLNSRAQAIAAARRRGEDA